MSSPFSPIASWLSQLSQISTRQQQQQLGLQNSSRTDSTQRYTDLQQKFQALSTGDQSQIARSEDLVSQALAEMTSRERDKIFNSIHGVQIGTQEEPQAVQMAIIELQKRLAEMRTSSPAFMLAESMNYSFVHNRDDYLKFLRVDDFDVRKAATRMIKYYEFRRDVFGESVLCKTPSLDELTSEEIKILRKGSLQWYVESCRALSSDSSDYRSVFPAGSVKR